MYISTDSREYILPLQLPQPIATSAQCRRTWFACAFLFLANSYIVDKRHGSTKTRENHSGAMAQKASFVSWQVLTVSENRNCRIPSIAAAEISIGRQCLMFCPHERYSPHSAAHQRFWYYPTPTGIVEKTYDAGLLVVDPNPEARKT